MRKNWKIKINNKDIIQIFEGKWVYNEAVYQLVICYLLGKSPASMLR